jgi:hypothetical protein
MDGFTSYKLKNSKKENDCYIFEFKNNQNQMSKIVAKVVDPKLRIQIWQTETMIDMKPMFSYDMVIPSRLISRFPILYTLTSDMVDQSCDKFDDIDLEKEFKK